MWRSLGVGTPAPGCPGPPHWLTRSVCSSISGLHAVLLHRPRLRALSGPGACMSCCASAWARPQHANCLGSHLHPRAQCLCQQCDQQAVRDEHHMGIAWLDLQDMPKSMPHCLFGCMRSATTLVHVTGGQHRSCTLYHDELLPRLH